MKQDERFDDSINALIELGSNSVANLVVLGQKNILSKKLVNIELWESSANDLPEEKLQNLIKGFVLIDRMAERSNQGYGLFGSTSPVAYLCRCYARRFPEKEGELTGWVVRHRVNEYEPFGTVVMNKCLSFAAHNQAISERNKN